MGSLRSWRPTSSRRSTSRVASGTCSPGPSRSYVATAARSPSPSGRSEKADGQDRRGGAPTGQELPAELILAYLASGCRVNRTQATAALSELISVGLLACRDGRYSLPKAPAPASPPASHRRGGPPHRSLPDAGVTYREHLADVGPLLEAADQLQARDESEKL